MHNLTTTNEKQDGIIASDIAISDNDNWMSFPPESLPEDLLDVSSFSEQNVLVTAPNTR